MSVLIYDMFYALSFFSVHPQNNHHNYHLRSLIPPSQPGKQPLSKLTMCLPRRNRLILPLQPRLSSLSTTLVGDDHVHVALEGVKSSGSQLTPDLAHTLKVSEKLLQVHQPSPTSEIISLSFPSLICDYLHGERRAPAH